MLKTCSQQPVSAASGGRVTPISFSQRNLSQRDDEDNDNSAGEEGRQDDDRKPPTSQSQSLAQSASQASKLKSSVISRVPPAKSRLKQPVASMAASNIKRPTVVATAAAAAAPIGRANGSATRAPRPTSLALKSPTSLKSSEAPRVYSSILPKLSQRPAGLTSTTIVAAPPQSAAKRQELVAASQAPKSQIRVLAPLSQGQQLDRRKAASKAAPATPSGALESRLKGLKSLVAVVRPQGNGGATSSSTRANSSPSSRSAAVAAAKLTNGQQQQQTVSGKSTSSSSSSSSANVAGPVPSRTANGGASALNPNSDTQVKLETGKVEFSNHKDVNGNALVGDGATRSTVATAPQSQAASRRRGGESKQDLVGRLAESSSQANATTPVTKAKAKANDGDGQISRVHSRLPNSPQCLTQARIQADNSDQFEAADEASGGGECGGKSLATFWAEDEYATRDKKQQADGKQSGGPAVATNGQLNNNKGYTGSVGKRDHSDKEASGGHLLKRLAGRTARAKLNSPQVAGKCMSVQADGNNVAAATDAAGHDETANNYYNARNLRNHFDSTDDHRDHDDDEDDDNAAAGEAVAALANLSGRRAPALGKLKLGSPAIQFNCGDGNNRAPHDNNNCNNNNISAHAINNSRIQPKPMGHQVLSLMMLDVGLVPTPPSANNSNNHQLVGNHHHHHHHGKHEHPTSAPSSLKRSYVRIQGDCRQVGGGGNSECDHDECRADEDVNSCFFDNRPSCSDHDRETVAASGNRAAADRLQNRSDNNHFYESNRQQQGSSLQNCATHEMLGLQVRFENNTHRNNDNLFGSISLPSSPRMHRASCARQQTPTASRRARRKTATMFTGETGNNNSPSLVSSMVSSSNQEHTTNQNSDYLLGNKRREELQRAIEALSISCNGGNQFATNQDRLLSVCDNQLDYRSQASYSSSCSSLNHCPPLLALSNELNGFNFERLVRSGSGIGKEHQQQHKLTVSATNGLSNGNNNRIAAAAAAAAATASPPPVPQTDSSTTTTDTASDEPQQRRRRRRQLLQKAHSPDQVAQVTKQHQLLTNDLNVGFELQLQRKIDHVGACAALDSPLASQHLRLHAGETMTTTGNEEQLAGKTSGFAAGFRDAHIEICDGNESGLANHSTPLRNTQVNSMDQQSGQKTGHQQQRSNSICGQDFHSSGSYQRLKHSICNPQLLFDDHLSQMTQQRLQNLQSPFQQLQAHHFNQHHQQQQQIPTGRSPSPISVANYSSPRDNSVKYASAERQLRPSHLHASLECLNFSDHQYSPMNRMQPRVSQQSSNQQNFMQANQHYATSYVLAPPPANTIINQNGDQDLAAAAMGIPSQYQSSNSHQYQQQLQAQQQQQQQQQQAQRQQQPSPNGYGSQTQALISRALAQVTHSPYRRMTSSNIICNTSGQNQVSQAAIRAGHSSLSLASSSYILEDKLHNEIRKLQSELQSEKEKNEALNSQLNINSSLMSAFEQSLTTLNTRLRQLTTLNEKKDNEIAELREQIHLLSDRDGTISKSPVDDITSNDTSSEAQQTTRSTNDSSEKDCDTERSLHKTIEDLKRQLIEKDRLLTDTRLEALSAAHQLEQLESKLNGEHSLLVNEDDLDEGVNLINHSPSESDATTDSAHFSEMNSQLMRSNRSQRDDLLQSQMNDTKES